MSKAIRRELAAIVEDVMALGPDDRVELLAILVGEFCPGCGRDQPPISICQCQNDE